jgi:hypothetical protein
MSVFNAAERRTATAISELAYCNPFTRQRIELERIALDEEFDENCAAWNLEPHVRDDYPNVHRLVQKAAALVHVARGHLARGRALGGGEEELLRDLALLAMYDHVRGKFELTANGVWEQPQAVWQTLLQLAREYLGAAASDESRMPELSHLFACFYQLRRAFHNAFHFIIGRSRPAARLRSEIWESIFTHDMRRYQSVLFARMKDFTALI